MTLKNSHISNNINHFHLFFQGLEKYKYIILVIGFFVWLLCPIGGVIPLLLFSQVQVSSNLKHSNQKNWSSKKLGIVCIFIVLITITVNASTYVVFSDLETYVGVFEGLNKENFFSYMNSIGMEPLTFLIPSFAHSLIGDHEKVFLLTQSLTMNSMFTLFTLWFSPNYYPTVILLNITSMSYFWQLFLMRQFYSFIFVIPLVYVSGIIPRLTLLFLALRTHSSAIVYALPVMSLQLAHWLEPIKHPPVSFTYPRKRIGFQFKTQKILSSIIIRFETFLRSKLFILIFASLLILVIPFVLENNILLGITPELDSRLTRFASNESSLSVHPLPVLKSVLFDLLFLSVFFIKIDYRKANSICRSWTMLFLVCLFSLIGLFFKIDILVRVVLLLRALPGFFYSIIFESLNTNRSQIFVSTVLLLLLGVKISYFYYRLILGSLNYGDRLWDGAPLGANILDYLSFVLSP